MRKILLIAVLVILNLASLFAANREYNLADYGITPVLKDSLSIKINSVLDDIKRDVKPTDVVTITLEKGTYHFTELESVKKELYISNHDQVNPKCIGILLDGWKNATFNFNNSEFLFDGTMLPIVILNSTNVQVENLSIDFPNPHITQVEIVENRFDEGIVFTTAPWVTTKIDESGTLLSYGTNWEQKLYGGIAFDAETRHIIYNTSDVVANLDNVTQLRSNTFLASNWKNNKLTAGMKVALRAYYRPTPGVFLHNNIDSKLHNITIHYARGMGLLAQLCENIELNKFSVRLRGPEDQRYFTTEADATHFSGCKGLITSTNGYYEGMMDDAINVHGTYLKIVKQLNSNTIVGEYMHSQSYGFEWGRVGDEVTFIRSKTMEYVDAQPNQIVSISPYDQKEVDAAKQFLIQLKNKEKIDFTKEAYGIENLTWTPKVVFSNNLVRNNRARGALFSTPKKVVVSDNVFDHTSGSAILLCGDCNGWYETGACKDVLIQNNLFINSLTSLFQFTNAVISIYPEIPDLDAQKKYFHGGAKDAIRIENNTFVTFDEPIVYAKSVDGLSVKDNLIIKNEDYKPYHWNKEPYKLERVTNVVIENNKVMK